MINNRNNKIFNKQLDKAAFVLPHLFDFMDLNVV